MVTQEASGTTSVRRQRRTYRVRTYGCQNQSATAATELAAVLMAYMRAHNTTIKRKGQVVKRYAVVWREPATDPTTGMPTPGKTHSRQESYPTRESAEARRDALNNARHNAGGTSALADAKRAGQLPFVHYASVAA